MNGVPAVIVGSLRDLPSQLNLKRAPGPDGRPQ